MTLVKGCQKDFLTRFIGFILEIKPRQLCVSSRLFFITPKRSLSSVMLCDFL